MTTVQLGSSLRATPVEVTLARARARAAALGITRATDITRLDRVGIPVYASIRPTAMAGSLCVNAGKGLRPQEAEVGAWMEAIEFALAEPGASPVAVVRSTARGVLDGRKRPEAILDLCPKVRVRVDLDAPMDCVEAHDVATLERALVPAELVFLPYAPSRHFRRIFGTSSNGLASGNTVREATVHALCELVERDVRSFEALHDTSRPVDLDTVDGQARALVQRVRDAGLQLFVRTARNEFGLPYFFAIINDPDACAPHLLNGGYGCHPLRSIAFVRAVSEAAQSRLAYIHGGRDDLVEVHDRYVGWSRARKRAFVRRVTERAAHGPPVAVHELPDHAGEVDTVERAEHLLLDRLAARGMRRAYRVAFCAPEDELQVVRVVVPRMEMFHQTLPRFGARLRDHARAHA
jgi:ribosomal protein S12 methylthiotransferase accessory factor